MFTIPKTTALLIGACFTTGVLAAEQAETPKSITIPAGELQTALEDLVAQTGVQLLYDSKKIKGLKTDGVDQASSAEAAVTALLKGTSLSTKKDETGAILISGRDTAAVATSDAARLRLAQANTTASSSAAARSSVETDSRSAGSESQVRTTSGGIPEILVEGKRTLNMDIQRSRDDPQPYVIFDREKIAQSGAQNLETFLRDRLPMNNNGIASGQRVTQAGNQSSFNLRGLGANQTLILIDGHRAGPGPSYSSTPRQSDINGIPLAAVERIEVLPATASGIYGGGATGGVINIILRHDYAGVEAKATYGNSFESDVASRRIDLSSGFNLEGGKTNVLVVASYSDQNLLTLQERPELLERYYAIANANAPASLLPPNAPPLGATPNIRSADGSNLVLRATGQSLNSSYTHVPVGYAGAATDNGAALLANAGSYNFDMPETLQYFTGGRTALAQPPRDASARASVQREFSSNVRAFVEGSFSESDVSNFWRVSEGGSNAPYRIAASAPNNPFTSDILVTVPMNDFTTDFDSSVTQTRFLGGVIVSLPGSWQAEMDYTWARTRDRATVVQPASTGADALAVRTGAVDVLRDTAAYPVGLASLFGQGTIDIGQRITFQDVALRLAGPVFELPGGPINVSTLLEYRDEDFSSATQTAFGTTLLFPDRSGSVASAYLETKIPLVSTRNGIRGVRELELQLAARADEYRTRGATGYVIVGSNTPVERSNNETSSVNPTIALRYQPLQDVVFRASYGTGFVAPDVTQVTGSVHTQPLTIIDPRRGNTSTTLQVGQVLQGGDRNLGPEKSENWSAGFVFTPRFVPNLRLSLDYVRIDKTDNIATYPTGPQGIINDEALLPGRVQRGANLPGDPQGWAGPITLLNAGLFNIARAQVEAFDLQLDYQWRTDLGTIAFSTVASRQTHYLTQSLAGQPERENIGVSFMNPQGFTGTAELKWQHRGWTTGWVARYYDDYLTADPTQPTNAAAIALQGNGGRVPSQTYHDVFVNWQPQARAGTFGQLLQGTEFQLGVSNIFDEMPPFDAYLFNVVRTLHSPLGNPVGATYQLSMTKRF